uniref:Uncharacterized protein n=1 Tax=Caenorhabditis tropicalis TaxID=1561998 RepID=A0A1I7UTY8_9PELO
MDSSNTNADTAKTVKNHNQNSLREVLDSKLPAKMDWAYPTESVKRSYEKPSPAVQQAYVNRGSVGGKQRFIPQKINH